jgi:hypothetical protein
LLTDNAVNADLPLPPIILTGGVSRIKNFARELETILVSEGCRNAAVTIASPAAKSSGSIPNWIALGALKAARHAREDHWQQVTR